MKKRELTKLALMGMASGLVLFAQAEGEASQEMTLDTQKLLAKHECKGKNGCGAELAERTVPDTSQQQPNVHDSDDMSDENENDNDDGEDEDEKPMPSKNPSTAPNKGMTPNNSKKNV